MSFGIKSMDDHWLRNLGFSDDMSPAPTIGANVAVSYALTPGASLYLPGSFDRDFTAAGTRNVTTSRQAKLNRSYHVSVAG
ncbi:omptin family outer membrane protease [Sinorhizobium medicae]